MLPDIETSAPLKALLGPTNTGKTWRAIRRMLGHRSGMIGLPLRLLAREVYDRVSAEVGEEAVALVTGEEKRVPAKPRYWVCTTESMPIDRPVDFLAVDEAQLVTHRERGHIFTDRVLRARGFRETWFLGSDTAEPLLRALNPTLEVERLTRLSRLSWAGPRALGALPPRSAVIAFSMSEVYQLAEALRRRTGGVAVVLGALSPRTRNAQVALYQSGEVPNIVATDAIGMGLNMDISHVAFASLNKFDGQQVRPLTVPELAQIAGRAGRYKRDGTFGTLDTAGELPADWILALEQHRFEPIQTAYWRNTDLDYGSVDALVESLKKPPPSRRLRPAPRAPDLDALIHLGARPEVRGRASNAARVALLWEICRLPDFRQTLTGDHLELLLTLWLQLTGPRERLDEDWLAAEVLPLDQPDGDIETLLTRIASIRTWTSIAFHASWVPDRGWQERTRVIEDRLSDALHERLVQRFVDRRALSLGGVVDEARVEAGGEVEAAGQALGTLSGLSFEPALPGDRVGWKAARAGLAGEIARRVERLVTAPHEDISIQDDGSLWWEGGRLGRWIPGEDLFRPQVRLDDLPLIGPGARQRVLRRLVAWSRDGVERLLAPLRQPLVRDLSAPTRGMLWALERDLGTAPADEVADALARLSTHDRRVLARLGVRLGTAFVYVEDLLQPEAVRLRGLLWATARGRLGAPLPAGASVQRALEPSAYLAMGYAAVGGRAIRVDALERALARLRGLAREGPFLPPAEIASWLDLPEAELPDLVSALGWPRREDGRHVRPAPSRARARRSA